MLTQKIILDTDPGIDDAQAIAFALAHPGIDVLGLTTVFGNASVEQTTQNALICLDQFEAHAVPVAVGAIEPLQQTRYPAPDFVHGKDGLGNLNLATTTRKPLAQTAAEFIVQSANRFPGEISLVAIGPLTNIANAVALDSELPKKVKELVIMGGTLKQDGNVTPLAEANFFNDPHAADQVLAHSWPARIIGLDVTLQTSLTEHDLAEIRQNCGQAGRFLWNSAQYYLDFYSNRLASADYNDRTCAMHDASALVYIVERDAFDFVTGPARVICDGIAAGQLSIDQQRQPYSLPFWSNRPDVNVALKVDADRVNTTFKQILNSSNF